VRHHRIVRVVTIAALSVALWGCAAQRALDKGHDFVTQKQYRQALAHYERANRLDPDSEKAKRAIEQITPYAVAAAVSDAHEALRRKNYDEAVSHVTYIRARDEKTARATERAAEDAMGVELEALLGAGDMRRAYPFAARTSRLVPKATFLPAAFSRLRAHFLGESERLAAAKQFPEAMEALQPIEKHDDAMQAELERRRQRIRGSWADQLVARAHEKESNQHLGSAAALYAHAFEIASRPADRAALRRVAKTLRQQASFKLDLEVTEAPHRQRVVQRLLRNEIGNVQGVVWATDDEATLVAAVMLPPMTCSESYTTSNATQTYVARVRRVPNPGHARLDQRLGEASSKRDELAQRLDASLSKVSLGTMAATRCASGHEAPARAAVDATQAELARLHGQIERIEQRLAGHNARRGNGSRRRLARLRERAEAASRALEQAQQRLADAQQRCAALRVNVDRERRRAARLRTSLGVVEGVMTALATRLAVTPRTLEQEVLEDFVYEVRHHTRRCHGHAELELDPAWREPEKHHLDAHRDTTDRSNTAFPQYDVAGDDLLFPESDDELRARIDAAVANDVLVKLRDAVRSYYAFMGERALGWSTTEPDDASDVMVAIYLAAPNQLRADDKRAIAAFLEREHGLSTLDSLRR